MTGYTLALVTLPVWWALSAYGLAVALRYMARVTADRWWRRNVGRWNYPNDRDDYAREQAIEDGRMEYDR